MGTNYPGCVLHNCKGSICFEVQANGNSGDVQWMTCLTVPDGYDKLCFQRWPQKSFPSHRLFCLLVSSCPHQQEESFSPPTGSGLALWVILTHRMYQKWWQLTNKVRNSEIYTFCLQYLECSLLEASHHVRNQIAARAALCCGDVLSNQVVRQSPLKEAFGCQARAWRKPYWIF